MYETVEYIRDGQQYLFSLIADKPVFDTIYDYRLSTFVFFCVCSVVAARLVQLAPPAAAAREREYPPGERLCELATLAAGIAALVFYFFLIPSSATDYMDFSYLYEGVFSSFHEFLMKPHYFANLHVPGYLLLVALVRPVAENARYCLLIINIIAAAAMIIPLYRLCRRNMQRTASACATLSTLILPLFVFGLFRIAPYALASVATVISVYCFVEYLETGRKKHLAGMIVFGAALPFLHPHGMTPPIVMSALLPVYVFFAGGGRRAGTWHAPAAMAVAAAGSLAFNLSHFSIFMETVQDITAPMTERLGVYYEMAGGNAEFFPFAVRLVFNVFTAVPSPCAGAGAVVAAVFIAGVILMAVRGRYGLLFAALGFASCMLLIVFNISIYKHLESYPMPYRHMVTLAPFFMYVLFFVVEFMGRAAGGIAKKSGMGGAVAALLLMGWYLFNIPQAMAVATQPEMMKALDYVYRNVREYDGVIPGNIYFDKEYHTYFFDSSRYGYHRKKTFNDPVFNRSYVFGDYCNWHNITGPDGTTVENVMLNIAATNIDSMSTLLESNFLRRVWYVDRDTRRLGAYPDFSGMYEEMTGGALAGATLVNEKYFRGVRVALYELEHPPGIRKPGGRLSIRAGENDYYFVRGVAPTVQFRSPHRRLTHDSELTAHLPPDTDKLIISTSLMGQGSLALDDMIGNALLVSATGTVKGMRYHYALEPGSERIHIKMRAAGEIYFDEIVLETGDYQQQDFRSSATRLPLSKE